ncbi:MAG: hypothetical protein HQM16_01045 [Deltaproteobacteria bacterium]|nr:hypothetical protein [Deltaproteobacteria bacterium]
MGNETVKPGSQNTTAHAGQDDFNRFVEYLDHQGMLHEGQDSLNLDISVSAEYLTLQIPPYFIVDSGHSWRGYHVPPFWNTDGSQLRLTGITGRVQNGNLKLYDPDKDETTLAEIAGLRLSPQYFFGTIKPSRLYFTNEGRLMLDIPLAPDEDLTDRIIGQLPLGQRGGEAVCHPDQLQSSDEQFDLPNQLRRDKSFPAQLRLSSLLFTLGQLATARPGCPDPDMKVYPPPGNPLLTIPRMIHTTKDLAVEITAPYETINIPPAGPLTHGITIWQNRDPQKTPHLKANIRIDNPQTHYYRAVDKVDDLYSSVEEFKIKVPQQFAAVLVKLPDGSEDIFSFTDQGGEDAVAIILAHTDLIYERGFVTEGGDIVSYGHTALPNGGPFEIRLLRANKDAASYEISIETNGDTRAIAIEGVGTIEIPVLHDLYVRLRAEGSLNDISFESWVLSIKAHGSVDVTGRVVVPPLVFNGTSLPGLVIELGEGQNYVRFDDFQLSLDRGVLTTKGVVDFEFSADSVSRAMAEGAYKTTNTTHPLLGETSLRLTAGALTHPDGQRGLDAVLEADLNLPGTVEHGAAVFVHAEAGASLSLTLGARATQASLDMAIQSSAQIGDDLGVSTMGTLTGSAQVTDRGISADAGFSGVIETTDGDYGQIDTQVMAEVNLGMSDGPVIDSVFRTMLSGQAFDGSGQAVLETRVKIEPAGRGQTPASGIKISIPEVILSSEFSFDGTHLESRVTEGKEQPASPLGIAIVAEIDNGKLGRLAKSTVNLNLENMEIAIPTLGVGRFFISGVLLGQMDLVNLNADGIPNYRPVAGSIGAKIVNAKIRQLIDGKLTDVISDTTMTLTDNGQGRLDIDTRIAEFNLGFAEIKLNLSDISNDIAFQFDTVKALSLDRKKEIRYYDFPETDTVSVSGVFKAVEKNAGELWARYAAVVDQIQSGRPSVTYNGTIPIKEQRYDISGAHKKGSIKFTRGSLIANGKAQFDGVKPKSALLNTTLTLPEKLTVDWQQQLGDGATLKLAGDLDIKAKIKTDIDFVQGTLSSDPVAPINISGPITLTHTAANGKRTEFKIRIDQLAEMNLKGAFVNGKAQISLDVPRMDLKATLLEGFEVAGIVVPQDSNLHLPFTGFKGLVVLGMKDQQINLATTFTPFDFGPARLEIKGSPLEQFELTPMKGPVEVTVQGLTHGQSYVATADERGISLRSEAPAKPYAFDLAARVGSDLDVHLNSLSSSQINARYDFAAQEFALTLNETQILSGVDGYAKLLGRKLGLENINAKIKFERLDLTVNLKEKNARLDMVPPSVHPVFTLPQSVDEFFSWTKEQWQAWRDHMNKQKHLAVLSEKSTSLPASPLPRGKGQVYIDMLPASLSLNLDEYQQSPKKTGTDIVTQLKDSVIVNREWPNVTLPHPLPDDYDPRPAIRYSAGQDALFFMDPRDTKQIDRIQQVFQFEDPSDARRLFENGRIDVEDIIENDFFKQHFGADAVRGLLDSLFADEPSNQYFSEAGDRFLLALGDIREGLSGSNMQLVKWKKTFWSDKVRETMHRSFPDHKYQGVMQEGNDGVNQTTMAYLPFSPDRVFKIIQDTASYSEWIPGIEQSETGSGKLHASLRGGHDFTAAVDQKTHGAVRVITQVLEQSDHLQTMAIRYLVIPHARGGSLLVMQDARDFVGDDGMYYKGSDENLNEAGYADSFFNTKNWNADFLTGDDFDPLDPKSYAKLIRMDSLNNRTKRAAFPNQNPSDVFRYMSNRMVSNLHHRLQSPLDTRNLNSGVKIEPQTLTYYPGAVRATVNPKEFLFVQSTQDTPEDEPVKPGLVLKVEEADIPRVVDLIKYSLGCEEAKAHQMIEEGVLSFESLQGIPFLKERYHPDTITALARAFVETVPQYFPGILSAGERFLLYLRDICTHGGGWGQTGNNTASMDARAFRKPGHHNWSPHNNIKPSDGTDSIVMTGIPSGVSFYGLLRTMSRPENFQQVSLTDQGGTGDIIKSEKTECPVTPEAGHYCVASRINLVVTDADYIIKVPDQLVFVGKEGVVMEHALLTGAEAAVPAGYIGIAPWWWQPSTGFQENTGCWMVIPRLDGGFDIVRTGLLNTLVDGDEDAAMDAFKGLTKFIRGFHRETLKAEGSAQRPVTIKYSDKILDYDQRPNNL